MEWIVAIVVLFVGLIAAGGIYLGKRDPSTRAFLPSGIGLFFLGRTRLRPLDDKGKLDQKGKNDGSRAGRS
jgi:hypothetical protein